jgi:hypothetical protein
MVGADLVAQPTGAAVDHHRHLADPQPERGRGPRVVDGLDDLDLQEVVAGAEAAELAQPALAGPLADLGGIGVADGAVVLAAVQVTLLPDTMLHRPARATSQHPRQLGLAAQPPHRPTAEPAGDPGGQRVHQRRQAAGQVIAAKIGCQQANAAGDVEADTTGRNHAVLPDVGRGHPADGEAVTPVHVRHGVGRGDDAGQGRDVGDLLH